MLPVLQLVFIAVLGNVNINTELRVLWKTEIVVWEISPI
jgi:hypothetical protein